MGPYPDFERGKRVSAARLNAVKDDLDASRANLWPVGPDHTGTGEIPPPIYPMARITGVVPALGQFLYSYTIVGHGNLSLGKMPHFVDETDIDGNTLGGTDSQNPAFERSNNGAVPVDGTVIVPLEPAPDDSWVFDYPASSGGGGGTNLITTDGSTITFIDTTVLQFPTGTLTQPGGPGGPVVFTPKETAGGDIHTYRTAGGRFTSPTTTASRQDGNKIPCGQIYLYPFIVPVTQSFNRLEIYLAVPGFSTSLLQLAVYNTTSPLNDTPAAKVVQTTDIPLDVAIGLVGQNVAFTLAPGLYYLAANTNLKNSGFAQWRSSTETMHVLGLDDQGAPYFHWTDGTQKGFADGTPYGSWPAGAAMVNLHKDAALETATIYAIVG